MVTTHGVILAAGRGTRLGRMTAVTPKPMLEIGGTPLIDRIAAGMAGAGVERLTVVTGYLANAVERHVAARCPIPVSFVRQGEPTGTGAALRLVAAAVGRQPFMLGWGDIATDPVHFRRVAESWDGAAAGVIGVNPLDDVSSGAAVVFGEDQVITGLVEKPQGEPPSRWNNAGIMVLGPQIWSYLTALSPSPRGELELPDAIRAMLDAGETMKAVRLTGRWFDIGTIEGIVAADEAFAVSNP